MPSDQTVDTVVLILVIGLVALGLLSSLIGRLVAWRDARTVNTSRVILSPDPATPSQTPQTDQTDSADRPMVSVGDLHLDRLQLDRTKTAVIEVMVYNGWQVGEIRAVLKGDNGAIGAEVEAARARLGLDTPERTLRVRDVQGERVIPY